MIPARNEHLKPLALGVRFDFGGGVFGEEGCGVNSREQIRIISPRVYGSAGRGEGEGDGGLVLVEDGG